MRYYSREDYDERPPFVMYAHEPGHTIACRGCDGAGEVGVRNNRSVWSADSPDDLWDDEPCPTCEGAGCETCEVCGDPATLDDPPRCAACDAEMED